MIPPGLLFDFLKNGLKAFMEIELPDSGFYDGKNHHQ
jgi:hypothetical protein